MASKKSQQKIAELKRQLKKGQQILTAGILVVILLLLPGFNAQTNETNSSRGDSLRKAKVLDIPKPAPIPVQIGQEPVPGLWAKGVYVLDPESNIHLYEKNPDAHLLPASTTKIMTAIIALEAYDLEHVITITEEERTIGNTMNLNRGEQLTVRDLLTGLLVSSANDAALALALSYPETGYSGFVSAMNAKAKQLGLTETSFRNVSGVESVNHYVSPRDLAVLTQYALGNPLFQEMVKMPSAEVVSLDQTIRHRLVSTNQLLGKVEGVFGVKTGWTENAGECLVTAVERNGHTLIFVVLGSPDRFGESAALIEWAFRNFEWQDVLVNPS